MNDGPGQVATRLVYFDFCCWAYYGELVKKLRASEREGGDLNG